MNHWVREEKQNPSSLCQESKRRCNSRKDRRNTGHNRFRSSTLLLSLRTRRGARGVFAGEVGLIVLEDLQFQASDRLAVFVNDLGFDLGILDFDKLAGLDSRDTLLEELFAALWKIREIKLLNEAASFDEARLALFWLKGGGARVEALERLDVKFLELTHQVVIVDKEFGLVVLERDQTILIVLHGVFVDETSAHGLSHFLAIDRLDFGENARLDFVATVFREEDGHGSLGKHFDEFVVTTSLVRSIAAPRVRVETKEVGVAIVTLVASNIAPGVLEDITDVGRGVPDRDLAVRMFRDILFQVTLDGLMQIISLKDRMLLEERATDPNVKGNVLVGLLVNNFIGAKEPKHIRISLESLDHGKDVLQVALVISRLGLLAVEMLSVFRSVDVQKDVDTGGIEDGHALIVVDLRADVVDTNSIDLSAVLDGECSTPKDQVRTPRRWRRVASRRQISALLRGSSPESGL